PPPPHLPKVAPKFVNPAIHGAYTRTPPAYTCAEPETRGTWRLTTPRKESTEATKQHSRLTNPTITSLPYDSSGNLVNKFGFGAISGVRSPRILQLVAKIEF